MYFIIVSVPYVGLKTAIVVGIPTKSLLKKASKSGIKVILKTNKNICPNTEGLEEIGINSTKHICVDNSTNAISLAHVASSEGIICVLHPHPTISEAITC